jgi:hypothetical protein
LKDKILLLSRFESRHPGDRIVGVLDASKFSMCNRLLGGGSTCGKDIDHTVK